MVCPICTFACSSMLGPPVDRVDRLAWWPHALLGGPQVASNHGCKAQMTSQAHAESPSTCPCNAPDVPAQSPKHARPPSMHINSLNSKPCLPIAQRFEDIKKEACVILGLLGATATFQVTKQRPWHPGCPISYPLAAESPASELWKPVPGGRTLHGACDAAWGNR
jgi:hypothetical protein